MSTCSRQKREREFFFLISFWQVWLASNFRDHATHQHSIHCSPTKKHFFNFLHKSLFRHSSVNKELHHQNQSWNFLLFLQLFFNQKLSRDDLFLITRQVSWYRFLFFVLLLWIHSTSVLEQRLRDFKKGWTR